MKMPLREPTQTGKRRHGGSALISKRHDKAHGVSSSYIILLSVVRVSPADVKGR